jgi:hypothetical protein
MTSKTTTLTKPLSPVMTRILNHLMKTGDISSRDALLNMSIPHTTLANAVHRLRARGFKITTEFRYNPITGQRYGTYVMGA